ncbi:MAG: tRNA (N6-threonylcarbamoyladenosine(37)-N6)-methyltransferase TrmO [Anaerolineales bacterium]|uniref:tRNA (N6-threonylcarbamoyladenosine(37)-N6)-methyltransferase TrmO n=1 Tax=Candidatus Desulfolinea nitratireducens TaxID=2841698 RepID=A0A8J6NNV2_9CHLR|nr:tRNA (N6-threonylcarbamoyladenosine(37)-N6)-methyltransferase TrmO [Candidatus Desulfolinea nitratireducens]MBL6960091.1 tRNA (N6-threonylcarbamoyladenosine(37)-N6)-methyltransferase TrmO [Anaerolineales bacterium]
MEIIFKPIGIIYSPFTSLKEMPIQPTSDSSAPGRIEIQPEFVEGLKDLEGFSHIYLLYHFHQGGSAKLTVTPFLDKEPRGIFATRAPRRPNPIGLSLVKLTSIKGNLVYVDDIDILNGTPLIDIKPYIPEFENAQDVQIGWLDKSKGKVKNKKSDSRFLGEL